MTDVPPRLAGLASLLDAMPQHVRAAFLYCLALAVVETGHARLVETLPGDTSPTCVFETVSGDTFSVTKPHISQEEEASVVATLRERLEDDGGNWS